MGYSAQRPIIVEVTNAGTVYVPIARERGRLTLSIEPGGLTGIGVSYTGQNITRAQASSYDVYSEGLSAPAAAQWTELAANAVATPVIGQEVQAMALRLIGAGTGTATITILQED